ncbi:hypothetical protein BDW22DRAFT_1324389 [Trametopsis cervina]|nr:hypothetical protein BDW22DRAFT_1324389 [Trametopsis cervina]
MRVTGEVKPRPPQASQCITIVGSLKGLQAKILIDTGSSINAVSPAFAALSQIDVFPLDTPIGLQLGCVGSRSKINFGCQASLSINDRAYETYLDVVNLDHYDLVLGIPFLAEHRAQLTFRPRGMMLGERVITVLGGREYAVVSHKKGRAHAGTHAGKPLTLHRAAVDASKQE